MFIDLSLGTLHEPLTDRQVNGAQAQQWAAARAALFSRLGVRPGARVFLHSGNRVEFFIDLLAAWQLGACVVPVDTRLTAFEIEQLLRSARPALSVWADTPPAAVHALLTEHSVPAIGLEESQTPLPSDPQWPRLDDPALLLFTSGTTGQPKGVVHTHRSLRTRWNHQRERFSATTFARTLCPLPTQFAWALVGHCLYTWFSGGTLLLLPPYRQDVLLRLGNLCDELSATCLPTVPTQWQVLLRMTRPPQSGTLQCITSGTAPLNTDLWRKAAQWGSAEVFNIFGITETGWLAGASHNELTDDEPLIGTPWGAVIKVLESGSTECAPHKWRECAPGETGHLWVQTPALMAGYFKRDEFTLRSVRDGWFCTGDLGALDAQGRLLLRGRDKELINVGGAKVYPADIDALASSLEGVRDACTFGISDTLQGERVAIALVLESPNQSPAADALAPIFAQIAERLSAHQLPQHWYVLPELARNARGKLNRQAVAAQCAPLTPSEQRQLANHVVAA